MQVKEFKIPKKLNIMQLSEWALYVNNNEDADDLMKSLQSISIVTGVSMSKVMKIHIDDIVLLSEKCLKLIAKYNLPEDTPKEIINIDGLEFRFPMDTKKITAGVVVDIKKMGQKIVEMPDYFLATIYTNVNHEMIRDERRKLFAKEFPAEEMMNAMRFFFLKSKIRNEAISLIQMARSEQLQKEILKYQIGGTGLTRFQRLRKSITLQWRELRNFLILLYYFGKSISLKKRK